MKDLQNWRRQRAAAGGAMIALAAGVLGGCSAPRTTIGARHVAGGVSVAITPQMRAKAQENYNLSRKIDRSIVTRGSTSLKFVAITFDDGPHPGPTERLLSMLSELNVHATFFVVGKMALKAPYLLQQEVLQGSEVANHTYNHIHVTSLNDAEIARQIFSTNDVIERYTGAPPVLFRPPGGRLSWGAYRALRSCGMVTVLWTDDPKDYLNLGPPNPLAQKVLLDRLMKHIRPGGIILLHDGIEDTVAILPEFIERLHAQGYQVGTVTELLLLQQRQESAMKLAMAGNTPSSPQ